MTDVLEGDALVFDIGYVISKDFYFGPANGFTQEQWKTLREDLPPPGIALFAGFLASTSETESRLDELGCYYERVFERMRRHAKTVTESQQYFWLRPFAWRGSGFAFTFPWYDTVEEARAWIRSVIALEDGHSHEDMDEGWELAAVREGQQIRLVQGDGQGVVSEARFGRPRLEASLTQALRRCELQVARLSERFARDFWSKRPTGGVL